MVLPAGGCDGFPAAPLLLLVLVGCSLWPLNSASPIVFGAIGEGSIPVTGKTPCFLPAEFGFNQQITNMKDCPSLDRFPTVPMALTSQGVHPMVCCPPRLDKESICFPSDAWCPTYEDPYLAALAARPATAAPPEAAAAAAPPATAAAVPPAAAAVPADTAAVVEEAAADLGAEGEPEALDLRGAGDAASSQDPLAAQGQAENLFGEDIPTMKDRVCPDTQVCTTVSRCPAIKDLPTWPVFAQTCGFDTAESQMMICCLNESVLSVPVDPQPPRFQSRGKPYRCEDRHDLCGQWRDQGGCQLDRHFNVSLLDPANAWVDSQTMFSFMAATCPATCEYCGDKGCVDEHEKCSFFASQGACSSTLYGPFMVHSCRESCGVCGFLSPFNTEIQKTPDGSGTFSDPEAASFRCGQFKLIAEINGIAEASPGESTATEEAPVDYDVADNEITEAKIGASQQGSPDLDLRKIGGDSDETATTTTTNTTTTEDEEASSVFFAANSTDASIFCSGTVISDRWILSAAHCYDDLSGQGEVKLNTIRTGTSHVEKIETRRVFKHPKYKYKKAYDDVALVELGRRIVYDFDKFGDTPTCLDLGKIKLEDRIATVQGFGLTETGLKGNLLEGNVTIISNEECRTKLGKIKPADKKKVNSALTYGLNYGMLCTEDKDPKIINATTGEKLFRSSCSGDSGGPLFLKDEDKITLVGIVSGGADCKTGLPSWYTKVSFFRPWIKCIMETSLQKDLTDLDVEDACSSVVPSEPLTAQPIFPDIDKVDSRGR